MIDSHAHLNDGSFSADLEDVIGRARDAGVSCILDIGDGVTSSRRSIEIAKKCDFIFSVAGIHPHQAGSGESLSEIEKFLSHDKVVAVGETGLDYYHGFAKADAQRDLFERSLELACRHNLPVIVHCRQAFDDTFRVVKNFPEVRGVMHCFSGGPDEAERFLELGLYISFAGNVTFPRADVVRRAASVVPLKRLLLETDCPYLSPQAVRGKRNEPAYVSHVYDFFSKMRSVSLTDLATKTEDNFSKLFGMEIRKGKKVI